MIRNQNWSSVVSITNRKKTLFYLQQKDEDYWIPEYRLKYCFFGGQVEKNETELEALKRELFEEIDERFALTISKNSKKLFDVYFTNIHKEYCKLSMHESVLEEEFLEKLSHTKAKEGKGLLVKIEDFQTTPFFWDLKKSVLTRYLSYLYL